MGYWDTIKDTVLKGVETVVDITKDMASVAEIKSSLFMERRKLQNELTNLGDKAFEILKNKPEIFNNNEEITLIFDKLKAIEKDCEALEQKLKEEKINENHSSTNESNQEKTTETNKTVNNDGYFE